jgi:exosortase/archaeosortase family protein
MAIAFSVPTSSFTDRLSVIARVAIPAVLVAVGLSYRVAFQSMEATSAVSLARLFGFASLRSTGTPKVLVLSEKDGPFYALVTFGCSSLPVLLTFAAVGLLVIRASIGRRLLAASTAALILFTVNVVRVAAVSAIGASSGITQMARVHDWFGTAMTLLGGVFAACAVYVIAALPEKNRRNSERATHA